MWVSSLEGGLELFAPRRQSQLTLGEALALWRVRVCEREIVCERESVRERVCVRESVCERS